MRMRKILMLVVLLGIISVTSGCGHKVKALPELQNDLVEDGSVFNGKEPEIQDFSIIKRKTNEEEKTDEVFIKLALDYGTAVETLGCVMYYTEYNDGWRLDGIDPYYGNEVEWSVVPKELPSNEQIMESLIEYSHQQISDEYTEMLWLDETEKDVYFFEDGKYHATVYPGKSIGELGYQCMIDVEREFELVFVEESLLAEFVFDTFTYQWTIMSAEVVDVEGQWYVEGFWRIPNEMKVFEFSKERVASYENQEEYSGICRTERYEFPCNFSLRYPTPLRIAAEYESVGDPLQAVNVSLKINPDKIWYYDWDKNFGGDLQLMELSEYAAKDRAYNRLEVTGITAVSSVENEELYIEKGCELVELLNSEPDFQAFQELIYAPNYSEEELKMAYEGIMAEYRDKEIISFVPWKREVVPKEAVEEVKAEGIDIDEAIELTFGMIYREDEIKEYEEFGVLLAKREGKIYIFVD